VHDVHYLKDEKELFGNCIIIVDKEYIRRKQHINLFKNKRHRLLSSNEKQSERTKANDVDFRKK